MDLDKLIKEIEKIDPKDVITLKDFIDHHDEIIMIGNGGSNAICSHIAQDYTKQLGKKSYGFSDASRLTCYINDYGRDEAYAQFLIEFGANENCSIGVILISSSGNSENVYRCGEVCKDLNLPFIMLTGFDQGNRMRRDFCDDAFLDIWVNSRDYGIVECTHQIFLHSILGEP